MMTKYSIHRTKLFRKQYKALEKRGYNMALLIEVIKKLADGQVLPAKYEDHPLRGDKRGYRDCHIKDDWVLVYKRDKGQLILILSETGTHSDILE
ncbi:MAG: type II toxin-antitoxin system YafQ family toxin [Clostridiales bacterium]|jgi:mRNA interferase YafQ|nr:type II toxin-antitoxin system YafQ family toxin [Clostridiales bacterium]